MASPTGQTGRGLYPRQLVIAASVDMRDRIDREALEHGLSVSEVTRTYIELGMQTADDEVKTSPPYISDLDVAPYPPYLVG